jgi:hypothetical protein
MRLKVLAPIYHHQRSWDRDIPYMKLVAPVHYRDGWYLLGELCWHEFNGQAAASRPEDFRYALHHAGGQQWDRMSRAEGAAWKTLANNTQGASARTAWMKWCKFCGEQREYWAYLKMHHSMRKRLKVFRERMETKP